MRTKFSFLNVSSNFLILLFRTIMTFIVRTIFIKTLGEECLGINSLFMSILSMLSLAELGLGVAVSFSLYHSLANKDDEKTSILMVYFKKFYNIIGIVILVLGLIVLPFIPSIVGKTTIKYVSLMFLLYLLNIVSLYFVSYKDILIQADQKIYELTKINFISYLLIYIFQILSLVLIRSFMIYILIEIVISIAQRIIINRKITKKYKNINFKIKKNLPKKEVKPIKEKIKAMFLHKIGNYLVTGTDSIIISKFVGIVAVGIYANYLSIINMTTALLNSLYTGVSASFGNLAAKENKVIQERVFNNLNFLSFIIYGYICIMFLILVNPFITIWIGKKYLLSTSVVILLCINFYMNGLRLPIDTVKEATGTYIQDKYIPLIQAILNLIISIGLTIKLGVSGVVLGTVISYIILPLWFKPYVVYKYVFQKNVFNYIWDYIKKILILICITILVLIIINFINIKMNIFGLIFNAIIITICYFSIIIVIFQKTEAFKYYISLFKKIVNKKKANN